MMTGTDTWQLIPLLMLAAYIFYLTYYYALPMFFLKVLLFYAHIRYRGSEIQFVGGKIIMKVTAGGEERMIERVLEADPSSRFFAMTVRSEFRGMLRELKNGRQSSEEKIIEPQERGEYREHENTYPKRKDL